MSFKESAAAFVTLTLALHGCGTGSNESDGGETTLATTTATTTTTLLPAQCPTLASTESESIAKELNEKFFEGNGSGVLTRSVSEFPDTCTHETCIGWELDHANSFSLMSPYSWKNGMNRYIVFMGTRLQLENGWPGFIASPEVLESMVLCSWPQDGDSSHKNEEAVGSTPANCGCRTESCGQPDRGDWCTEEPHSNKCAYRPNETAEMMEAFRVRWGTTAKMEEDFRLGTNVWENQYWGYNEVLVEKQQWTDGLPHIIKAFYIPNDCPPNSRCYNAFAYWYEDWKAKYGPWPIVRFDATNKEAPYSAFEQLVNTSGFCGDEECVVSAHDAVIDAGCQLLENSSAATPEECCNSCSMTDGCEAFVHWSGGPTCYLETGCKNSSRVRGSIV